MIMNNNANNFNVNATILNQTIQSRNSYVQAIQTNLHSTPNSVHHPIQNAVHQSFQNNINRMWQNANPVRQTNNGNRQLKKHHNSNHSNYIKTMPNVQSTQNNQINLLNQLTNPKHLIKDNELIWLENFVTPTKISPSKRYCNACCIDLNLNGLDDHLRTNKHINNRKKLNNNLLEVNLFQISKHYNQQLTEYLEKSFASYRVAKDTKLSDFHEFEDFLNKNLDLNFRLTLFGSIQNETLIKQSDINVNIEILDEKDEENQEILKIIKQLVKEKGSNKFKVIKMPNLDRHERAYFMSQRKNIINLINIENLKQSQLIGQYVNFDPRVKVLMYNIRQWANYCELDSILKASYRPVLFQIMVLYFLQHCNQPVLPNFHNILNKNLPVYGENDSKHHQIEPISDDELLLIKRDWKTKNEQNIGELWIDFFKFYLFHFDHEKTYVNIVHHQFKEKTSNAFSVCNVTDGVVFSVIFNWRIHYERMNKLLFTIYKHSCFFPYPNVNTENLETYLQFIFSLENFKRDQDFKLTRNKDDDRKKLSQKLQFDLKQLWRLSIRFNFKVCVKQELENFKKPKFNIKVNHQVTYPELPKFCILCKSKTHFVKECDNMVLPVLLPLDENRIVKCAMVISLISDYYYKAKSVNENSSIIQIIDEVKNSLNKSIQSVYPNAKLELYGSFLNGFGHLESDLDFALLFQPGDQTNLEINKREIVKKIGNSSLKKNKDVKELQMITHARVPIIKLKYVNHSRSFECDISIENRLAFCNTHLLRVYCTIDPRVPRLGLLVKKFARICQICYANQGGMKSYAFSIMLIYFLQQCKPPVLPVLHELEKDKLNSETIMGWEVKFFHDLDRIQEVWEGYKQNKKTIGELFIEFFIFYTEIFDFNKHTVSIRQSQRLTKFEKRWTSMIAIEDPFLLNHNLSDALEISMVNYVKASFILSRNHFTNFAQKGFDSSMRIEDLFQMVFNENVLKVASMLPFGKGCQLCFKIGHKKLNCPEKSQRNGLIEYQQIRSDEQFPTDFEITLSDVCKQNIQYLALIEKFENILRFKH